MSEPLAQEGAQVRDADASPDMGYGTGPLGLPVRPTARALLLDSHDRVLLFRFDDAESLGEPVWWSTPGGGVDPGESIAEAGARELLEETGLRVAPEELGPVVAWNEGAARFVGGGYWFLNRYYVLRVDEFALDTSRWEELESSIITRHRWWSAAELAELSEPVHPHGLRCFLAELAEGRLPDEPVDLGPEQQVADAVETGAMEVAAVDRRRSDGASPAVLCDGRTAAGFAPDAVC